MKSILSKPKIFLFAFFLGVLSSGWIGAALNNTLLEIVQTSYECNIQVDNRRNETVRIITTSNLLHARLGEPASIEALSSVRYQFLEGECEGLEFYPEGPLFVISVFDLKSNTLLQSKTLSPWNYDKRDEIIVQ